MRKSLTRIWPNGGQWPVLLSNWLVVAIASVITGAVALVAEDLLPKNVGEKATLVPGRLSLLLWALAVLVVILIGRAVMHDKKGTLFYVQGLDETMANRHEAPLKAARRARMGMHSITHWLSVSARNDEGVIDVVGPCHELGRALEDAVNSGRTDTGYVVVPNMFWPMALAVGSHLPHPNSLRLLELPPQNRGQMEKSKSRQRRSRRDSAAIEFPLTQNKRRADLLTRDVVDIEAPQGERVGVWLALTANARNWKSECFARFGVSRVNVVSYQGKVPGRDGYPPNLDQQYSPNFWRSELEVFGRELADLLWKVKREAGQQELVVIAMVPKTTALALGWYLSQMTWTRGSFFADTHLMHYDEMTRTYIPMRVRESQPLAPPAVTD